VYIVLQNELKPFAAAAKAIGKPEWVDDPKFNTPDAREKVKDEIYAAVEAYTITREKMDIVKELGKLGVPCGPVLSMKEIAEDESLRKCGTIVEVDQPGRGKFLTIGCPPKFSSYTPQVKPAPALGEHTDEVLKEIGYTAEEIADLRQKHVVCKKNKVFVIMYYITDNPNASLTDGMHLLVDALKMNGVEAIFGVVGIPVTDLARYAQQAGIRYIGFRHEQSAGHAAAISGYLTKKPGICLTVSAPGFLNGLTALAEATVNGFPMIQISGSSDRNIIDLEQGDYEGLDQMNVAKPFVKAAYRINRPQDIAVGVARAIRTAVSGRPGGVYLDITTAMLSMTMDVQEAQNSLFVPIDPAPVQIPCSTAVKRA
jgi:hypothetical protein